MERKEWIEHSDGSEPPPSDALVVVRFRDSI